MCASIKHRHIRFSLDSTSDKKKHTEYLSSESHILWLTEWSPVPSIFLEILWLYFYLRLNKTPLLCEPRYLYPFICWQTSRLVPWPGCCDWDINKPRCASISVTALGVLHTQACRWEPWYRSIFRSLRNLHTDLHTLATPVYMPTNSVPGLLSLHMAISIRCLSFQWW